VTQNVNASEKKPELNPNSLASISLYLVNLFQKKSNPDMIIIKNDNDNDSNKNITKNDTPKKETPEEKKIDSQTAVVSENKNKEKEKDGNKMTNLSPKKMERNRDRRRSRSVAGERDKQKKKAQLVSQSSQQIQINPIKQSTSMNKNSPIQTNAKLDLIDNKDEDVKSNNDKKEKLIIQKTKDDTMITKVVGMKRNSLQKADTKELKKSSILVFGFLGSKNQT